MSVGDEKGRTAVKDVDDLSTDLESQVVMDDPLLIIHKYPGFEKYNSHINWISNKDKLTKRAVQTIINVLNDKVNEDTQDGVSTLKYLGIESVCFRTSLAFLYALLGNDIDCQYHLIAATGDIETLKEHKFVDEEYLVGLKYIRTGVNVYNYLQRRRKELLEQSEGKAELSSEEIQTAISCLDSFETMSVKSRVGVLAAQHYFDGQLRRDHEMQIQFLMKMIQLDPNYYLWHINLHNQYSLQRRERKRRTHLDDMYAEVKEIMEAIKIAPNNPFTIFANCDCIPHMANRDTFWLLRCGYDEFKSEEAVLNFIKAQAKNCFASDPESVLVSTHIADCFSSLLPPKYRDLNLSKYFLQQALNYHPNSSKAHHKLGILILMDNGDINDAVYHLRQAVAWRSNNFDAKLDLSKAYMSTVQVHRDLLTEHFAQDINHTSQEERLGQILFLRGCMHMMLADVAKEDELRLAGEDLIRAAKLDMNLINIMGLDETIKLFRWNVVQINFGKFLYAVQALKNDEDPIIKEVRSVLQRQLEQKITVQQPEVRTQLTREMVLMGFTIEYSKMLQVSVDSILTPQQRSCLLMLSPGKVVEEEVSALIQQMKVNQGPLLRAVRWITFLLNLEEDQYLKAVETSCNNCGCRYHYAWHCPLDPVPGRSSFSEKGDSRFKQQLRRATNYVIKHKRLPEWGMIYANSIIEARPELSQYINFVNH